MTWAYSVIDNTDCMEFLAQNYEINLYIKKYENYYFNILIESFFINDSIKI